MNIERRGTITSPEGSKLAGTIPGVQVPRPQKCRRYLSRARISNHISEDLDIMTVMLSQISWFGLALLQEASMAESFSIMNMIRNLGAVAWGVIIILFIMSIWSIAIMIERYLTFNAAKKQSREFAPKVAQALKQAKIDDAISISEKFKKSHLAMVVNAGLQEFRAHQVSTGHLWRRDRRFEARSPACRSDQGR